MRYDINKLELFCTEIVKKLGANERDGRIFAQSLVNAEARAIKSHGLTRMSAYEQRITRGLVDTTARLRVIGDEKSLLHIDACNGMGAVMAHDAMEMCIERAKEYGSCFAAVRGGNHFGYGAFFTEQAAKQGMIGFAVANAPVSVAPIGGKSAVLGTNPLSLAIPAKRYRTMILDMATSVVARGKIRSAAKERKQIPLGWAVDEFGAPTTDPNRAKTLLPFGGPKGYGIGIAIEVLCSCLTGATAGKDLQSMFDMTGVQNSGFFLGAIDIAKLMPLDLFEQNVDTLFDYIKNSEKAEGTKEIFLPGEIEYNNQEAAVANGVALSEPVLRELRELAEKYNIPFSCEK